MKLYRIKKSDIDKKGRGLYATRDIKKGTKIIDYVGKLITKKQTEESDKYDNSKPIYLFTINKRYDLDGDFPWNTAGLINHSCDNNCDYDGKGLKIWVKQSRILKKVKNLLVTMVLDMMKITNNFHVNVNLKTVVVIL
jgi:SET domain-containing protein